MKLFIHRRFILQYFALSFLFLLIFHFLKIYYIRDFSQTPYSIDEYVFRTGRFIEPSYLITAKVYGYDYARYYMSFFIADMIFPLIYSCLFLSIITGITNTGLHKSFVITIIAGCVFDYLEDFSFAAFLSMKGDGMAPVVAVFVTAKSVVNLVNVIICFCCLFYYWKVDKAVKLARQKGRE